MGNKHNPTSISDKIYDNYISMIEEDTILEDYNKIVEKFPLLQANGLAVKIVGCSNKYYKSPTDYDISSAFMIKHNKALKKFRHSPSKREYGSEGNVSIKDPEELIKLKQNGLEIGRYYVQLDKKNYAIMDVVVDAEEQPDVVSTLYIIGKKCRKYLDEFNEIKDKYGKVYDDNTRDIIVRHLGTDSSNVMEGNFKHIDAIIFSDKKTVLSYINNWFRNIPDYYKKYHIIAKLSIMIYGPPGTGKSSFATAIAKYFNIKTIDSYDPAYFNDSLSPRMEGGGSRRRHSITSSGICVLDDIDCICKSREDDDSSENMATLSSLLSFLDNPAVINIKAEDNIYYPVSIVIATTNYYDKLDPAIKRAGRFDYTFEMKEFNREEAIEYCNLYNLDLDTLLPEASKKTFKIIPAELQTICLANLDSSMKKI